MKKLVILLFSFVIIPLHGQTSDAFSISAEECFLLGDYNSSFNVLSLSNAANNSGIRIGYYKNHNQRFSTSVSLGVIGTSNRQYFSMKSVPIEIVEHISLGTIDGFSIAELPLLWQLDAGLSSALTTATSASFNLNRNASFSESLILGLSLQLINTEREELYIGYRHNFFIDDWLDGFVEGKSNDHLMRFQTTYRIKLGSDSKWKKAFEELSAENIEMKKFISQNQLVPRTSQVKDSVELNIEQPQHKGDSIVPIAHFGESMYLEKKPIKNVPFSQPEHSISISAEECFLLGDHNSSFNILSLSNAANNSGIRIGYHWKHNQRFSTSISLGVIGTSNRKYFSMKSVPVEIIEHISLGAIDGFALGNLPFRWQLDAGLSSALTTATSTSFNLNRNTSFSESLILGLSLQLLDTEREELYIGYRHNYFFDDWLDGLTQNSGNDHLMRFQTTYRIKLGTHSKWKKAHENLNTEHVEMKKLISQNQLVPNTSTVRDLANTNPDKSQKKNYPDKSDTELSSGENGLKGDDRKMSVAELQKTGDSIKAMTSSEKSDQGDSQIARNKVTIDESDRIVSTSDQKNNHNGKVPNVDSESSKEFDSSSRSTNSGLTIEKENPYVKVPLKEKEFAIVIGSFKSEEEAISYAKKFRFGKAKIIYFEGLKRYRVIAGVYSNSMEIEYRLEELKYYGFKPWITKY